MAKLPLITVVAPESGPVKIAAIPDGVGGDPKGYFDSTTGAVVVEKLDAPVFTTSDKGLVPTAPTASQTTKFLRGDGTWAVPAGGGGGGGGTVDSVTGVSPISVDSTDPANPEVSIAISFGAEYFVNTSGNDTTGDGTSIKPFATITKALEVANAVAGTAFLKINVSPGDYTGSLNITRQNILIQGAGCNPEERVTKITGTVTVDSTGIADAFNVQVALAGLFIQSSTTSPALSFTGTGYETLSVSGCLLYASNAAANVVSCNSNGAQRSILILRNCTVLHGSSSASATVAKFSYGDIRFDSVRVYTTGSGSAGYGIELLNSSTLFADRSQIDVTTTTAAIFGSGTSATQKLLMSNSSVTNRGSNANSHSISITNGLAASGNVAAYLWQNILSTFNASAKAINGTLGQSLVYYGSMAFGPNAIGAINSGIGTGVSLVALTEKLGNLDAPLTAANGGTGLGSPSSLDAGKVLAVKSGGGGYELVVGGGGGGGGTVVSVTGTSPITVNDTDPTNPVVGIDETLIGIDSTQVSGLGSLATKSTISNTDVDTNAAIERSKLGVGTAGYVVINDGSTGAFSSEAQLSPARGGTGLAAPVSGDVGKVLTAKNDGTYELATPTTGTVTSLTAGTGLTGGTITNSGTISLESDVVDAATKGTTSKSVSITVDTYGRVTSLSDADISIDGSKVSGTVGLANGGTGQDLSGVSSGQAIVGTNSGVVGAVTVSKDATLASDGQLTVAGIQGRAVSSAAPIAGQSLVWSDAGTGSWVPGDTAAGGSGGGGVVYFMNAGTGRTDGGLPLGTYQLGRTAEVSSSPITSMSVPTGGWTRIAGFVSDTNDPSIGHLPAGIWDFNIYATSTADANTMVFRLSLYEYNGSTDPELGSPIATTLTTSIYEPTVTTQYQATFNIPQTDFTNKRLYLKLEAQAYVSGKNVTFDFGDSFASHTHTTVPSVTGSGFVKVLNDVIVSTGQTIDLNSGSDVGTSVLGVVNGGTGAASVSANTVFAGPNGSSGAPSFRALVAADVPDLSSTYLTVSSASSTYAALSGATFTGNISAPTITASTQLNTNKIVASSVLTVEAGTGTVSYITPPTELVAIDLSLEGGAALSGNANGGHIYLLGGAKSGTGTNGAVYIGTSNTSAVTIGATEITTTVAGTLAASTAAADTNTTQVATTAFVVGQGYLKSATASSTYAPLDSPTFTGTPAAPTASADTNTTQVATTAFVVGQASSTTPAMDGSATTGTSLKYARADHVHPIDTSRAPLDSPTLTGTPAAPTASAGTNSTQIATTAFVTTAVANAVGVPYDLPVEIAGTPPTSTRVVNFKAVRAFRLASSGHQGGAVTAPTGTAVVCTVKKNNATIGSGATITFNTDGTVTFSIPQTDFGVSDLLTVETPSNVYSADTLFLTLAMSLK